MALVEFRVLGPLEVRRDGELVDLRGPKQRALLGLFLLRANEVVAQEEIIHELWGEDAPPTARASLQNRVHALRKLLGPEFVERQPSGYVFHVDADAVDLGKFERLVLDARSADPAERAVKLREALALWRGTPLVEFPTEPFAQHEIARLDEERLSALEDRIRADLELGAHTQLVPELEALVQRYPLRERLWSLLMLALYRAGRQADALAAYGRAHRTLTEELGVEPSTALRDLQRAILVQDEALDDPTEEMGWAIAHAAAILPRSEGDRAESLFEYGVAFLRNGETRRGVSTLRAAARLAERTGARSVEERARLYLSYIEVFTEGASISTYLDETQRALARFERTSDEAALDVALPHVAQMLAAVGREDDATAVTLRCVERAVLNGDAGAEALARTAWLLGLAHGTTPAKTAYAAYESLAEHDWRKAWSAPFAAVRLAIARALILAQLGCADEADTCGVRALDEAKTLTGLWLVVEAMEGCAAVALMAGRAEVAARHLRAAHDIVEVQGDRLPRAFAKATLAHALALAGETEEAADLALRARAEGSPEEFTIETGWRRALALTAAARGRFDEAIVLSDEARARAAASDYLVVRGLTLEEAARIRAGAGDAEGAAAALREALDVYERKGALAGSSRVRSALVGG